jgi:hypothetical protein
MKVPELKLWCHSFMTHTYEVISKSNGDQEKVRNGILQIFRHMCNDHSKCNHTPILNYETYSTDPVKNRRRYVSRNNIEGTMTSQGTEAIGKKKWFPFNSAIIKELEERLTQKGSGKQLFIALQRAAAWRHTSAIEMHHSVRATKFTPKCSYMSFDKYCLMTIISNLSSNSRTLKVVTDKTGHVIPKKTFRPDSKSYRLKLRYEQKQLPWDEIRDRVFTAAQNFNENLNTGRKRKEVTLRSASRRSTANAIVPQREVSLVSH